MVGLSVFLLIGIIAILAVFFYFVPFLLWISARVSGGKNLSYPIILDENQKSTATSHCSSYD